jgi:hypothetical protein
MQPPNGKGSMPAAVITKHFQNLFGTSEGVLNVAYCITAKPDAIGFQGARCPLKSVSTEGLQSHFDKMLSLLESSREMAYGKKPAACHRVAKAQCLKQPDLCVNLPQDDLQKKGRRFPFSLFLKAKHDYLYNDCNCFNYETSAIND